MHTMQLIYNKLFNRFPNLQILLNHLNKNLYFWLYQLNFNTQNNNIQTNTPQLEHRPAQYLKKNFYISTNTNLLPSTFQTTFTKINNNQILFNNNYPFNNKTKTATFVNATMITNTNHKKIT